MEHLDEGKGQLSLLPGQAENDGFSQARILSLLPEEILDWIFHFLEEMDLASVKKVNSLLRRIASPLFYTMRRERDRKLVLSIASFTEDDYKAHQDSGGKLSMVPSWPSERKLKNPMLKTMQAMMESRRVPAHELDTIEKLAVNFDALQKSLQGFVQDLHEYAEKRPNSKLRRRLKMIDGEGLPVAEVEYIAQQLHDFQARQSGSEPPSQEDEDALARRARQMWSKVQKQVLDIRMSLYHCIDYFLDNTSAPVIIALDNGEPSGEEEEPSKPEIRELKNDKSAEEDEESTETEIIEDESAEFETGEDSSGIELSEEEDPEDDERDGEEK